MSTQLEETCYACSNIATGKEHLPPRCFFPKGMRKSLITAPSCDEHNSEKSKEDEYIKSILLLQLSPAELGQIGDTHEVQARAFERAAKKFLEQFEIAIKSKPELRNNKDLEKIIAILDNEEATVEERLRALHGAATVTNSKLGIFGAIFKEAESALWTDGQKTISTAIDVDRLFKFFNLLAQGLFYTITNRQCSKQTKYIVIHDLLLPTISEHEKQLSSLYRSNFDPSASIGENKEIFCYELFRHVNDASIVLNMRFFNKLLITAVFDDYAVHS